MTFIYLQITIDETSKGFLHNSENILKIKMLKLKIQTYDYLKKIFML